MKTGRVRWECYILAVCCLFALLAKVIEPLAMVASGEESRVCVPIIMYHSLLKDSSRANDYTVSPRVFESDLKYLYARGYETVTMQDLINYVYLGVSLPEKPVVVTFDDGHLNNLTYGLPILEEYRAKAVISVVGAYVEEAVKENDPNSQYAYVTWNALKKMQDSGRFEIQNHSYNLHQNNASRGIARRAGEVLAVYQERLINDVLKMQNLLQEHGLIIPTMFTYPFGLLDREGEQILRGIGFLGTLTCEERPNYINSDPECLFLLGRYNRPSGISTEQFMKKVLRY